MKTCAGFGSLFAGLLRGGWDDSVVSREERNLTGLEVWIWDTWDGWDIWLLFLGLGVGGGSWRGGEFSG